jgi:outer membrane protein OmpA-like peptidoglycan-associated protein
MRHLKLLLVSLALLLTCSVAQAQFGKKLGKAIENAAERATLRKAEEKTESAVNKGIDKATDPNTYKDKDGDKDSKSSESKETSKSSKTLKSPEDDSEEEAAQPANSPKAAEMAYAKSDFVPGDEIIFEDLLTGEQLGEFPSMWDLVNGNIEIAKVNGENVITLPMRDPRIRPLMKNPKNYLPEIYTIEYDVYLDSKKQQMQWCGAYLLAVCDESGTEHIRIETPSTSDWYKGGKKDIEPKAGVRNGENNWMEGKLALQAENNTWAHIALSVNKRAVKAYFNGVRFANVPNYNGKGTYFEMKTVDQSNNESILYIRNFRIAKGAVPLYDRMMTDGKIITYGITFDVGKSTIKPESMGEINRIAVLMKDNPELKFSVEGHTDSTGSEATNQTLSDARSKAVVDKLVETGIAADRLQSAGKGQSSPIADNGTDEGRAKNRRVEFVKTN